MRLRTIGSRIGERPSAVREGRESRRSAVSNGAPGGIRTPDQWLRKPKTSIILNRRSIVQIVTMH